MNRFGNSVAADVVRQTPAVMANKDRILAQQTNVICDAIFFRYILAVFESNRVLKNYFLT